jgi:hypothetical protein
VCTPILLITVFVLLLAERLRFSITRDLKLRGCDTQVQKVFLGGSRAFLA